MQRHEADDGQTGAAGVQFFVHVDVCLRCLETHPRRSFAQHDGAHALRAVAELVAARRE